MFGFSIVFTWEKIGSLHYFSTVGLVEGLSIVCHSVLQVIHLSGRANFLDSQASLQIKVRIVTVVSLLLLCGFSSPRFCTEDTARYTAYESHIVPESTLNQDIMNLSKWFTDNCSQVNATKTG